MAPKGREYDTYIKSLKVVRVIGVHGMVAFAVVSSEVSEKVGDILSEERSRARTVVYVQPSIGTVPNPVVEILEEANPWPVFMLPNGIPKKGTVLIHRVVTEGEIKWAKDQAKDFIFEREGELRAHGLTFGKVEDPEKSIDGMESLPDYMSLALRSEFGINVRPHPHWRPAIKWLKKNLWSIVQGDERIRNALTDPLFREHKRSIGSTLETMPVDTFRSDHKRFQGKVLMNE